jgi:polyadenylate-binding protein 2
MATGSSVTFDDTTEDHDSFDVELGESSHGDHNFDAELGDTELSGHGDSTIEDPELEAIKARVREMEEEAEKIRQMQNEVEKQMNRTATPALAATSIEDKLDADNRSVWIGNVDYGATAEELEAHFHGCGAVSRVTILCDKFTGHPKGFAYMEFAEREGVDLAMALDDSLFRGRQIKVTPKRTNRPGISTTNRPPRGRGGFRARASYHTGYAPRPRGRYRPRRSYYYSPY